MSFDHILGAIHLHANANAFKQQFRLHRQPPAGELSHVPFFRRLSRLPKLSPVDCERDPFISTYLPLDPVAPETSLFHSRTGPASRLQAY
jgi:hypothetical protein